MVLLHRIKTSSDHDGGHVIDRNIGLRDLLLNQFTSSVMNKHQVNSCAISLFLCIELVVFCVMSLILRGRSHAFMQ
jgi:hypothetical protein